MTKLKQSLRFLYEQFYHFLLYIIKHPFCSVFLLAGVLVCYLPYAFATDYYVDSEVVINIPGTSYNWLEIGRYGLVFARKLLGTSWYNPYYTGILLLFFLWLTGICFSYIAGKLFPRLTAPLTFLAGLVFITYPTFSEQYYFHFQSAEIAFGLFLSMLATGLFYFFVKKGSLLCFVLTLPVYVLTFAIYQSFIPLALCCYLAVFLALIVRPDTEDPLIRRSILGSILHFLLAFGISQGINRIFFASSDYLSGQVIWTETASLKDSVLTVIYACLRMLTGQGLFYTCILLLALLCAAAAFWRYRFLKTYRLILGALSAFGIALTPFLLTFVMGTNTAIRSQFTYSLAAVFLLLFAIQTLLDYKPDLRCYRLLSLAVLLIFSITQISTVRFIWTAHEYVADYDRETATDILKIMYDSFIVDEGSAGCIFWGYLQPETPYDEALEGSPSYLFTSVFNLEHRTEPYCYFSSNRILGYMESMGHGFTYPSSRTQSVSSYIMDVSEMPAFPAENCFSNDREAFTLNLGNSADYTY